MRVIKAGRGGRDATLHPFSSTSMWNLPVADSITTEASNGAKTVELTKDVGAYGTYYPMLMNDQYYQPIDRATESDPLANIIDANYMRSATGSLNNYVNVPADARIAPGTDAHMGIISPEGRFIHECWWTVRNSPTEYEVGRYAKVDLYGSGQGPMNGVRAYGGSMIGGVIREHEVQAGVIPHALSMVVPWDMLYFNPANIHQYGYYLPNEGVTTADKQPGWPVGMDLAGFGKTLGYQWPASEEDYSAQGNYAGVIPMAALFVIPASVDVDALGWSPALTMMGHAAQDYGVYVVDMVGADVGIPIGQVEFTPATASFRAQLTGGLNNEIDKLRKQLRYVTNNTAATPAGGALGAARRRPLATPLRTPPAD